MHFIRNWFGIVSQRDYRFVKFWLTTFQVFSSQANDLMQELLFKLAVTDSINDLQYKIDFQHKVIKNTLIIFFYISFIQFQ